MEIDNDGTAKPFDAAHGSAWREACAVVDEADKLEELIQLKLENPGMTRKASLEWAIEMRRMYSPNAKDHV